MKNYIDRMTGEVFSFEGDGSQDQFIPDYLEPLSDLELSDIRKQQESENAPTHEDFLRLAISVRDDILVKAASRIGALQDAADRGDASDEEKSLLPKLKGYRIEVNRVHLQPGFPSSINWPKAPE